LIGGQGMTACMKEFAADRGGNFAIFASLMAIPLVLGAGVALDFATISRTKAELQQALDAAVLAVAREGKEISDQQAMQIAKNFVTTNYHLQFADLRVLHEGSGVRLDASTKAPISFGALFGYDDWQVAASSSADIAYVSYEIALVLDTTGSMAGGKLTALKDAVDGMIESMSVQIKDRNKLKLALVPFAGFVNVGPEHGPHFDKNGVQIPGTGAAWLDLDGRSTIPQTELVQGVSRFQIAHHLGKPWKGCVETRMRSGGRDYDVADLPADPARPESLFVPAFAIDEGEGFGYANSYILAPGVNPLDKTPAGMAKKLDKYGIPVNSNGKPIAYGTWRPVAINDGPSGYQGFAKGPDFACGMQPLTPLSNDYGLLRSKVKQLNAQGNTNIMEGVAWGHRVLTPGEPFAGASDPKKGNLEKIMIVLSDGANTLGNTNTPLGSHYSSFGYLVDGRLGMTVGGSSATNTAMNERTLAACRYAKEYGITVYTIRLEEPDVKTGTMLRDCASSPAHYFDAPSRTQLDDVFKTIKERIVKLRLSS
jgi:Flp pilus assembly protein TadG